MAERKLIDPSIVQGIVDAVCEKGKTTEPIKVSELPDAIRALNGVGEATQEVVEAITGIHAEDDIPLSNVIAKVNTDEPTEQVLPYGERATADGAPIKDGVAFVQSLKGQSLKMVQQMNKKDFYKNKTLNGITAVKNAESGKVIANGTSTGRANLIVSVKSIPCATGEKILILGCPKGGTSSTYYSCMVGYNDSSIYTTVEGYEYGTGNIITIKNQDTRFIVYEAVAANTSGQDVVDLTFTPQVFNVTAMFGEGNEPATPDEFAQRLGYASIDDVPYIPYTEGEIVNMTAESIVSKDAEGAELSTFPLNLHDIKDSEGNELFPYGLCGVGDIKDEVTETQSIKRIGCVDMGECEWRRDIHAEHIRFSTNVENIKIPITYYDRTKGILCAIYKNDISPTAGTGIDMTITKYSNGSLFINNFSYENVTSFKQAMQGVLLYYELETPIVVDLPPHKQWYRAENGGTEELQAESFSAPLTAGIGYRYDIDSEDTLTANELI